jgi:hypothetical protein
MDDKKSNKIYNQILQVSQEKEEIDKAIREWRFSGEFKDHQKPSATCELCGNSGLRYHFRIVNRVTGELLWVGSQCILNFDLSHPKANVERSLSSSDKRKQIQAEIEGVLYTRLLQPIQQLYQRVGKSDRRRIHWAVGRFQRRGAFSPKDLAWLLQAMRLMAIPFPSEGYALSLRTRGDRQEFSQLSISARKLIEPYLSPEQMKKV